MVDENLQQARNQLDLAKQQAQTQRTQLETRRREAQDVERRLTKQQSKIPVANQSRLRSGIYSGLQGRKVRGQVSRAKSQIKTKKSELKSFKEGLSEFENKELKPFESRIKANEASILDYESKVKDYNTVYDFISRGKSAVGLSPSQRKIYDKAIQSQEILSAKDVGVILNTSGEPIGSLASAKLPSLGSSSSPKITIAPPRNTPRTNLVKDFQPLSSNLQSIPPTKLPSTSSPSKITGFNIFNSKPKLNYTPQPNQTKIKTTKNKNNFNLSLGSPVKGLVTSSIKGKKLSKLRWF